MRQADKKYFGDVQQGRLNADDSPFVVGTNEWVNAENIRTGSTDKGFTGVVESVGGNAELPEPPSAQIYYFNVDFSPVGGYFQLGTTPSTSPDGATGITSTNSLNYLTDIGIPGVTGIDAGSWFINCQLLNSGSTTTPTVKAEIQIYPLSGIPITIATTNTVSVIGSVGFVAYNLQASIPQQTLLPTDRIAIKFIGANISTGAGVSFNTQNISSPNYYAILTTNIGTLNPTYDYITIGSVEDTENKRIFYFNYDASPNRLDRIVCYYTETNKQYNVLLSSQVQGGLNFSKDSLIHGARVSNKNILSFPDGINNEPRKINIDSGIKANDLSYITDTQPYIFPLDFSQITLIKPPPTYSPSINKIFGDGTTNFIQYQSFEFAYQFKYYDNEITVPSTYSIGSRLNSKNPTQDFNAILVQMSYMQNIPSTVIQVNLIVRISDGNPLGGTTAFIVKTWDKSNNAQNQEINNHNGGLFQLQYTYYNNITGEPIASDDVLRPFDNVPIFSQTHEVSKSRYFLGNNIVGYDTPKETSLNCKLGTRLVLDSLIVSLPTTAIKVGYFREHGNNWSVCSFYVFINGLGGNQQGWYVINGTDNYDPGTANANSPLSIPSPTITYDSVTFVSASWADAANFMLSRFGQTGWNINDRGFNSTVPFTGFSDKNYSVLAQKSTYKLGIVFYDYAMRKCGVCNINNNQQPYNVFSQAASVISNTTFLNFTSNTLIYLKFNTVTLDDIIAGDNITISGSTGFNGTYIVGSILLKNINTTSNYTEYKLNISSLDVPTAANTSGTVVLSRIAGLSINTPVRDYNYTSAYGKINWDLNNTNALTEIPEWAYYYSVVKTLNLRTRLFLESVSASAFYITKKSTGEFEYTNKFYLQAGLGIAIDVSLLAYAGLGYTFSEGDVCILLDNSGNIYELPVIGQNGNYIHLRNTNIGTLKNVKFAFQIYTPYKTSEQEPYYEFSQTYGISNPKTLLRSYSITSGVILSDSFVLQRNVPAPIATYFANTMSPNDLYWKRWDSDAGKPNIVTTLGQVDKNTNITWSDTYISGTQINGSSTFRLGSESFVSDDCGSITKLQLTSKVQDQGQGSVMLALCNSEINSMYLGETQITDSTGKTQFFSASTGVISTINILKGNYGCISPESVVQYRGKVYFVDLSNGRVVQYSDNGLDAISNVKMSRFWKNWAYKYQSLSKAEIEAFGDRPYIFSIVDSGHDELLISLPKLSDDPPKGYLPDYPSTVYPFDALDYQGKTMVFCLGTAAQLYPHWQGSFTFTTENFVSLQNRLFSFKGGRIFEHNQDAQNRFYGAYSPSSIMFTSNILTQVPKVYDNFAVESNLVPSFVYFYNNYPYIQTSDLDDTSFVNLEGIWYANILRNKIVPTATGFTTNGLLTAEVMRNTNMYVQATFSPTTEPLELRLIQLGTSISKGHIIT